MACLLGKELAAFLWRSRLCKPRFYESQFSVKRKLVPIPFFYPSCGQAVPK
jgi:hypothetical protein